ncbi:MAG: AmmeMemoRadiSam system protein B [Elusimicrobiota bacterium]|nr:AmmeMemoRadiSam system protein B [Elusimicrobiota bacterium]
MIRKPQVAGSFYPAAEQELEKTVKNYLGETDLSPAAGIMVPHAGYIYSGRTAGLTYRRVKIPDTVIIIGPNHTGRGAPVSVMAEGAWQIPPSEIEINSTLAGEIISGSRFAQNDTEAHAGGFPRGEHCLEVQLPFLYYLNPSVNIVPVVMGVNDISYVEDLADAVISAIKGSSREVLIAASSDMSHFISEDEARKKDRMAIDKIMNLDYRGLMDTVRKNNITMCGAAPAAVMVKAADELGARKAELIDYTTSADTTGDSSRVVGYAGIILR